MSSVRRGRPVKITREKLAKAASELGFADLKLIEVAQRLDVTLQTLYNHIKDRQELLHLAAEVLEERYAYKEDETLGWIDWWRARSRALKQLYNRTPGFATILMSRPLVNAPPLTQHWEMAQLVAERAGFTPLNALWANLAVHEFIYAWAAREDQLAKQGRRRRRAVIDAAFAKDAPHFVKAVKLAAGTSFEERFQMALDALLTGLLTQKDRATDAPLRGILRP